MYAQVLKGGPGSGRYPKGSGGQKLNAQDYGLSLAPHTPFFRGRFYFANESVAQGAADQLGRGVVYHTKRGYYVKQGLSGPSFGPTGWKDDGPSDAFDTEVGTTAAELAAEPLPTSLGQAEDRIRMEPNEHAFILRGGIPVLVLGDNLKDQVGIQPGIDLTDAVLTHNHPSNSGLSVQDGVTAFKRNLAGIRAVVADGTWSLKRVGSQWPPMASEVLERVQVDVRMEFVKKITDGTLTVAEANASHHNAVWSRVVRELNDAAGKNVVLHTFEPHS